MGITMECKMNIIGTKKKYLFSKHVVEAYLKHLGSTFYLLHANNVCTNYKYLIMKSKLIFLLTYTILEHFSTLRQKCYPDILFDALHVTKIFCYLIK